MALVLVLPCGEYQQAPLGTGVELLTLGLGKRGEAVAHYNDDGEMLVESLAHDTLLARGDGGGDEYRFLAGGLYVAGNFGLQ